MTKSAHYLSLKSPIKPMLMALVVVLSAWQVAAEAKDQDSAEKRLQKNEALRLQSYSQQAPTTIDQANDLQSLVEAYPERSVDLEKNLQAFKNPQSQTLTDNLKQIVGQQWSIQDIRAKALNNNLAIKIARFNPGISGQSLREEAAKFDRTFFAAAKYKSTDTPVISSDNVQFTSDDPDLNKQSVKLTTLPQRKQGLDLEVGVKIPLRTGGTIVLASPISRERSQGLFDSDEYRSALRFSLSQPLLRNAGRQVNVASIQIAQVGQSIDRLKTRLKTIRVIATTDKAYWKLYEKWAVLDVKRNQYEYANENLKMVKRRVREGLTAKVEINRAQIGVAERMDGLIVADTDVKLAQRALQFYLNDIDDAPIDQNRIIPITTPNLQKYDFDRLALFKEALQNRIDLLEQELKLSADLIKIDYLENQTLPLFTLDYQYGALSDTGNRASNSYDDLLGGDFRDWSIGFKFEMPFTNEARKARLDRAVQQRMQRLSTKQLRTLAIKREIHDALDTVEQNWKRILLARKQVLVAGMNYEAELKQFNEGLRTMTEVLETLSRLGAAQIKEVKAITNYQTALVDAAYATGTLLGYGQLEIQ